MQRRTFAIKGRHLTTKHEPGAKLNDVNPGVYWQLLFFAWGYYRNSHTTKEQVLISKWFAFTLSWFGQTYAIGWVTGYPGSWVLPLCMKSETMRAGTQRFRLFFIPQTFVNSSAIHGSVESDVSFGELLADLKKGMRDVVKKRKSTQVLNLDDAPAEFHDSRVADFVRLDLINKRQDIA